MMTCAICGCELVRGSSYASPTPEGRAGRSRHHFVPERFFGRSTNRRGTVRERLFEHSPWGHEGEVGEFCYECHEELLHNPVLLPAQIEQLRQLVSLRGCGETVKTESRALLAARVQLFQEIIAIGIERRLELERLRHGDELGSR